MNVNVGMCSRFSAVWGACIIIATISYYHNYFTESVKLLQISMRYESSEIVVKFLVWNTPGYISRISLHPHLVLIILTSWCSDCSCLFSVPKYNSKSLRCSKSIWFSIRMIFHNVLVPRLDIYRRSGEIHDRSHYLNIASDSFPSTKCSKSFSQICFLL